MVGEGEAKFYSKNRQLPETNQQISAQLRKAQIKPEFHHCLVSKQTTLYYTFDKKRVYVVTIFDNRMNPKKLKQETK